MNAVRESSSSTPRSPRSPSRVTPTTSATPTYNKKLSESRAASVMKWLTRNGIDKARLTSAGFGLECPLEDNSTEEGRRVEVSSSTSARSTAAAGRREQLVRGSKRRKSLRKTLSGSQGPHGPRNLCKTTRATSATTVRVTAKTTTRSRTSAYERASQKHAGLRDRHAADHADRRARFGCAARQLPSRSCACRSISAVTSR